MKRTRWITLAVAAIVILNGCSFFGDDGLFSSEVTEEKAVEVASAVYSEVSAALSQGIANAFDTASVQGVHAAGIEPAVTAQSFDYDVSYFETGLSVTGTITIYDDGTSDLLLSVGFNNYSSATTVLDGTVDYDLSVGADGVDGSMSGNLETGLNDTFYDYSMTMYINGSSVSGSYSVDGHSFDFNEAITGTDFPGSTDVGNGSGGDSDNTATTGVSFYADTNGSYITIYVNGDYAGTLTQYFTSGAPDYGDPGTVTVALAPGTHSVYAEDLDGNQWSNNVTLTEGEQMVIRLNR